MKKEDIIKQYFDAWLKKESSIFLNIFNEKIIYSECYGPEYFGIKQVLQWFDDWNKQGTVLVWEIKQFIQQGYTVVAEWYFECDYNDNRDGFDGVSVVKFDDNCKIVNIKEFQSKTEHSYPYGKF